MEPETVEEMCAELRKDIQMLKGRIADMHKADDFKSENMVLGDDNVPRDQHGNMHANITLAFRCLEDARMRLGKVMQACQGGVSVLDR